MEKMIDHIRLAYNALEKVFVKKIYSDNAITEDDSNLSARITLGVLEKNVYLEYILSQIWKQEPNERVKIILKIGAYMLLFIDKIPDFAVVNETVNFVKNKYKDSLKSNNTQEKKSFNQSTYKFTNFILNSICRKEYKLPKEEDSNYLSITYSKPQWFIDRMIKEFGEENTLKVLKDNVSVYDYEHIRINSRRDKDEIVHKLEESKSIVRKTLVGGYVVKKNDEVKKLFNKGDITYQSPSSMIAVQGFNPVSGLQILDLCSAPGGKSVYLGELCPDSKILACDISEDRLRKVEQYAKRMNVSNIETKVMDATQFNDKLVNKYDYILVDAPCTCFGTFVKQPDVFIQHDESDIDKLSETQTKILLNAFKYLKANGAIIYSTCTLFKKEYDDVIKTAMKSDSNFMLEKIDVNIDNKGIIRLLPNKEWEGFFVAKLVKKGDK